MYHSHFIFIFTPGRFPSPLSFCVTFSFIHNSETSFLTRLRTFPGGRGCHPAAVYKMSLAVSEVIAEFIKKVTYRLEVSKVAPNFCQIYNNSFVGASEIAHSNTASADCCVEVPRVTPYVGRW